MSFFFSFAGNINELLDCVGLSQWMQRFFTVLVLFYIRFANIPVHPETTRIPIIIGIIFFLAVTILIITTVLGDFCYAVFVSLVLGLVIYYLYAADNAFFSRFPAIQECLTRANSKYIYFTII